jgi:hypothetical protein
MNKVLSLMDKFRIAHNRRKAENHAALVKVLERPMLFNSESMSLETSDVADWLMSGLWAEGYEISPRDKKDDDVA